MYGYNGQADAVYVVKYLQCYFYTAVKRVFDLVVVIDNKCRLVITVLAEETSSHQALFFR